MTERLLAMRRRLSASVRWRARDGAQRLALGIFGRQISCATCGRRLFRGIALVWRGNVRVFGASEHNVRVCFRTRDALEFHHMWRHECPSPERPWVN